MLAMTTPSSRAQTPLPSKAEIESLVQDAVVWANQHGLV